MSDIQQYLLDYDRNRTEATATAQRSAARMLYSPCHAAPPAGHVGLRRIELLMAGRTPGRPIEATEAGRRLGRVLQQRRRRCPVKE
jgi:hypothetical protein